MAGVSILLLIKSEEGAERAQGGELFGKNASRQGQSRDYHVSGY